MLAYACSWSIAVPLALQAQGVLTMRVPFALHYVSGLGPAIAALVITRLLRRARPGNLHAGQPSRLSHVFRWPLVGFLSPLLLTWLYNSSHGSVLAVVLWHASFNFVSASPNAGGFVAAVTSTLVMVWAVVIVWRYRAATLAAAPKHVAPTGVLAADDAQVA